MIYFYIIPLEFFSERESLSAIMSSVPVNRTFIEKEAVVKYVFEQVNWSTNFDISFIHNIIDQLNNYLILLTTNKIQ